MGTVNDITWMNMSRGSIKSCRLTRMAEGPGAELRGVNHTHRSSISALSRITACPPAALLDYHNLRSKASITKSPYHTTTSPFLLRYFLPRGPLVLADSRSEGSLMAKNRRRTRKKRTKQSRCMSFALHPATLLTDLMRCRPGDGDRHTP